MRPVVYAEFCELWNRSNSLAEVIKTTGQTKAAAATLACKMRKRGWSLKKLPCNLVQPIENRFWPFVNKTESCWLWTGSCNPNGYGQISRERRGMNPVLAHRLSWRIHFGEDPGGNCVLHHCDNPKCVRPDHLFLGDMADNTHDMMKKKRGHWQEKSPRAIKEIDRQIAEL